MILRATLSQCLLPAAWLACTPAGSATPTAMTTLNCARLYAVDKKAKQLHNHQTAATTHAGCSTSVTRPIAGAHNSQHSPLSIMESWHVTGVNVS